MVVLYPRREVEEAVGAGKGAAEAEVRDTTAGEVSSGFCELSEELERPVLKMELPEVDASDEPGFIAPDPADMR